MFRRSRKKIIVSIMGALILLFAVTLSVIIFASYREVRKRNSDMLERYVELYFLGEPPDGREKPMPESDIDDMPAPRPDQGRPPLDERPDFQLSTFYSVALAVALP